MGFPFAAVGLGLSVLGLGGSRRAAKAERAAARARAQIAKLENFRTTVNVVREARVKRAQVVAGAEASGVEAGSSAVLGGLSSLEAQLYSNLDYLQQATKLNTVASNAEVSASGARSTGDLFATAGSLLMKVPQDLWNSVPQEDSLFNDFSSTDPNLSISLSDTTLNG